MATALRHARRRPWAVLPLMLCLGLAAAACEQDEKPKAEKVAQGAAKPAPPSVGPLAANAGPAGACADEPSGACNGSCEGSSCGEHKADNACGSESCGCGMQAKDTANGAVPIVPITDAKVGDRTRCPVSHGIFTVRENSPKLEHDGKTYYFCCPGCVNRFMQNPEKFVTS